MCVCVCVCVCNRWEGVDRYSYTQGYWVPCTSCFLNFVGTWLTVNTHIKPTNLYQVFCFEKQIVFSFHYCCWHTLCTTIMCRKGGATLTACVPGKRLAYSATIVVDVIHPSVPTIDNGLDGRRQVITVAPMTNWQIVGTDCRTSMASSENDNGHLSGGSDDNRRYF